MARAPGKFGTLLDFFDSLNERFFVIHVAKRARHNGERCHDRNTALEKGTIDARETGAIHFDDNAADDRQSDNQPVKKMPTGIGR